jgi:hypothetical protein
VSFVVAASLVLTSSAAPAIWRLPLPAAEHYRAAQELDRYRPVGTSDSVAVLVHGCCGDRRDLADLARALARRGVLVLNLDVHAFGRGGGWPETYEDVVCGVAAGRAAAGDRRRVAVIGWDDGALVASAVALGWRTFAARTSGCRAAIPSTGPDDLIGISGHYGWPGDPPPEMVTDATIRWFGGEPDERPYAWSLGNPGHWVRAAESHPRLLVMGTAGDTASAAWAASLLDGGIDAESRTCGPGGHATLALPRTSAGAVALGELAAWLGPTPPPWIPAVDHDEGDECRP